MAIEQLVIPNLKTSSFKSKGKLSRVPSPEGSLRGSRDKQPRPADFYEFLRLTFLKAQMDPHHLPALKTPSEWAGGSGIPDHHDYKAISRSVWDIRDPVFKRQDQGGES